MVAARRAAVHVERTRFIRGKMHLEGAGLLLPKCKCRCRMPGLRLISGTDDVASRERNLEAKRARSGLGERGGAPARYYCTVPSS